LEFAFQFRLLQDGFEPCRLSFPDEFCLPLYQLSSLLLDGEFLVPATLVLAL
jgi:hypothetical protein